MLSAVCCATDFRQLVLKVRDYNGLQDSREIDPCFIGCGYCLFIRQGQSVISLICLPFIYCIYAKQQFRMKSQVEHLPEKKLHVEFSIGYHISINI